MMNESNAPTLATNATTVGLVFLRTDNDIESTIERSELGMGCIELIAKLGILFDKARNLSRADYIDDAGKTARNMLSLLESFCGSFLNGQPAQQSLDEIAKAVMGSHAFDAVLKTRPLGNAVMRAFWKADEIEDIKKAHTILGKKIVRATTATLFHAVMNLGADTEMGREIDQAAMLFVNDLQEFWRY